MTDLTITNIGDAWTNSNKTGVNYGSSAEVRLKSGEMRGYLLPPLQPIAGRTVLPTVLVGRVLPGHVAQTYTVAPITERWSPGRVTHANRPAVNGAAQVTEAVSALPDGGLVEIDVTSIISAVSAGTDWFGLRIETNSTAAGQGFYATDSGSPAWELLVTLSDAPDQPTDLRPDGGAVSTNEPILAWDFIDLGGESTEQAESQVQVDSPAVGAEPDEVAPDYDSGWVANINPEYDLAAVTYTPPASPAQSTFWRVRVKDAAGEVSEWSDWADFTVTALPTLVVDSPTGTFGDPSPTLLAHLSSGTVSQWKAWATGPELFDIRDETGMQTGPIDWSIPERNRDGRRIFTSTETGYIILRVWDSVDRTVAVGENPYVETRITVNLANTGALTVPTNLSVAPIADGDPRLVWTFDRTEAADVGWVFMAGDEEVARVDAADVSVNAGTYTWTDSGQVEPMRPQVLKVKAIEGANQTSNAATVNYTHNVKGVWLLPEDEDVAIVLAGTAVDGFLRTDRTATYTPLVGPDVEIVYDTPPRTGTFEGTIDARQDVWEARTAIRKLRNSRTRKARMVWGSESIMVRLKDTDVIPAGEITPRNLQHTVRFGFVQVGD